MLSLVSSLVDGSGCHDPVTVVPCPASAVVTWHASTVVPWPALALVPWPTLAVVAISDATALLRSIRRKKK